MFILLIIYTFFVFIRPQEYIPAFKGIPVMPLLMIILFISFLFSKEKKIDLPQDKLLMAFFFSAVLSHLLNGNLGNMAVFFGKFAPIVLLYYIITHILISQDRIRKFFLLIILVSLIMAVHGIHQFYNDGIGWTGQTFTPKTTRIRYIGIFGDPNDLSLVFLFSIPLLVYFFANTEKKFHKFIAFIGIGIILYAIFLTQSRGAMVSLLGMSAYYLFKKYGIKKGLISGLILLIPILIVASGRILNIDAGEESAHGRIDAWYQGIQMLIHSPVWGVGPGMFTEYNYLTAHNSFVLCFSETGLLGYTFWFSMISFAFLGLIKATEFEQSGEEVITFTDSFYLTISLIGFLIASFFLSRTYTIVLYIILGIISSYIHTIQKEYSVNLFENVRNKYYLLVLGASMLSVFSVYVLVRLTV